jgi:hypothetical protein
MRGAMILIAFFSLFTAASLLIPSPMFPGSLFSAMIGTDYTGYVSALLNGVFYGAILWLVFVLISKRLETEK